MYFKALKSYDMEKCSTCLEELCFPLFVVSHGNPTIINFEMIEAVEAKRKPFYKYRF